MSLSQGNIPIQFVRHWHIRRPLVYRYLEKQFVDSFFEKGVLRIGSFSQFSKHKDEERLDAREGAGVLVHQAETGDAQTIYVAMKQATNSYVLSCSTRMSSELAEKFETNSGFRINDTTAFADAIAQHIPGFRGGIEGPCVYVTRRMVQRTASRVNLADFRDTSGNMSLDKLMNFIYGVSGDDLSFMKDPRHAQQNEYRLLWFIHGEAGGHVEVCCPEARRFCTRFEELQAEKSG